ncbi:MAG: hypothetical protein J6Q39_07615 [Bacteroidales bacterium]|nr:hypothetical protein [Bacteroidales bacterium]
MKEKTTKSQIVQVHFFEPVEGKTDYYFGSLKAIYAKFTKEQVGISLDSLYTCKISQDNAKVTKKCRIIRQEVTRVAQ